jgi:hypothetical protein
LVSTIRRIRSRREFGFSYAPFNDDKTSIRGGFGMFYDKVEGNLIFLAS